MIKKLGNCYLTRKLMAKLTHFSPKKNFKKEKEKIGVFAFKFHQQCWQGCCDHNMF